MRTTVDLDETVLAAARSLARVERISLGRAISELALRGLRGEAHESSESQIDVAYSPFSVIVGEGIVTDEMIAEHRDD